MSRSTSSSSTSSSTTSTDSFESVPELLAEVKNASHATAPPISSSTTRFVNVELIHQMMAMTQPKRDEKLERRVDGDRDADEEYVGITDVIRTLPPLTDASWVTEEMLRICADYNFWMATSIPPSVWAPPGTPKCPFSITEADVRRFLH